jgi:hypothetical protein
MTVSPDNPLISHARALPLDLFIYLLAVSHLFDSRMSHSIWRDGTTDGVRIFPAMRRGRSIRIDFTDLVSCVPVDCDGCSIPLCLSFIPPVFNLVGKSLNWARLVLRTAVCQCRKDTMMRRELSRRIPAFPAKYQMKSVSS